MATVQALLARDGFRGAAAGGFGLKVGSTLLTLGITALLTNLMGAERYGTYAFIMAWVNIVGIVAVGGIDKVAMREISLYALDERWNLYKGLLRFSATVVLALSSVCAAAVGAVVLASKPVSMLESGFACALLAAALLPLRAMTYLRQGAMRGMQFAFQAQLPEMLYRPGLLVALLIAVYLSALELSVMLALGLTVGATVVALAIGTRQMIRRLPAPVRIASPEYRVRSWTVAMGPFLLLGILFAVFEEVDVLLLGYLSTPEDAGIYAVAHRGMRLVFFAVTAVNMVFAARIAACWARGDVEEMQDLFSTAARTVLALGLPILIILALFGSPLLSLFGSEFQAGYAVLLILLAGSAAEILLGPTSQLLLMGGRERILVVAMSLVVATKIAVSVPLIRIWGMEGAAVGSAAAFILWSAISAITVYRTMGVLPTMFGSRLRRRSA